MNPKILLFVVGIGIVLLGVSMFFLPLLMVVSGWPSWSVPTILVVAGVLILLGAWVA